MKPYFLFAILLLCFSASCAHLPEEEPVSVHTERYQAFLEQPNRSTLIYRNEELLPQITPDNAKIEVVLGERRARMRLADEVVIDTPVSPGKKSHPTPTGDFTILNKKKDKRSNLYGTIYNAKGGFVASGDRRKKKMPKGGKFVGASMPYWMRLTRTGIGLHVGYVPNYAASHGCIRLPKPIAPVIFEKTRVGTPVTILP